jgi:hypothetical protein
LLPATHTARSPRFTQVGHEQQSISTRQPRQAGVILVQFHQQLTAEETHAPQDLQNNGGHADVVHWSRQIQVAKMTRALNDVVATCTAVKPAVATTHT